MTDPRPPCALTIAGSDSGGGAGIQADLKTFAAHGVHGLSVIAALTAQNTRGVNAVHVPPLDFLRAQLDACFDDFDVRAVKIGMLANAEVIAVVADVLRLRKPRHVVLDPVMIASTGARLLDADALHVLRTALLPLATVLTPNIPEAEWLLDMRITTAEDAGRALAALRAAGVAAVLLKGAHLDEGGAVIDRYADAGMTRAWRHLRLPVEGHGTGCTLASAIAAQLCLGVPPLVACAEAGDYVHGALRAGYRPGLGNVVVLDHFWRRR